VRFRNDLDASSPHWNIQVQVEQEGRTMKDVSNIHVYVDEAGNPTRAIDTQGVWNNGKPYEFSAADMIPR